MEYTQWVYDKIKKSKWECVLILVVMEYTQWDTLPHRKRKTLPKS